MEDKPTEFHVVLFLSLSLSHTHIHRSPATSPPVSVCVARSWSWLRTRQRKRGGSRHWRSSRRLPSRAPTKWAQSLAVGRCTPHSSWRYSGTAYLLTWQIQVSFIDQSAAWGVGNEWRPFTKLASLFMLRVCRACVDRWQWRPLSARHHWRQSVQVWGSRCSQGLTD